MWSVWVSVCVCVGVGVCVCGEWWLPYLKVAMHALITSKDT